MSGIHTSLLEPNHPYTKSDTPWIIDASYTVYGKLVHYLSGGGMRTFGRTVEQERVRRCHRRFLVWFGVLAVLWCIFYFV